MNRSRESQTEKAQFAWTLIVAIGVAFAAIYQLQAPRNTVVTLQAAEGKRLPATTETPSDSLKQD